VKNINWTDVILYSVMVTMMLVAVGAGIWMINDAASRPQHTYIVDLAAGDPVTGRDLYVTGDQTLCLTPDGTGKVCYPLAEVKRWREVTP